MPTLFAPDVDGLQLKAVLWANLPDPTLYDGTLVYCPNTRVGAALALAKDGIWTIFARTAEADIVTTDVNGEASVVFTQQFPLGSKVVVSLAAVNAANEIQDVSLKTTPTIFGFTLKARKTSPLPALGGIVLLGGLTSALSNLSLVSAAAAGVQVHFLALRAA